jgi:hypothetical protein
MIDRVRELFEKKSYTEIVEILERNKINIDVDVSDSNSELLSIATFSFYHNNLYQKSIIIGEKLLEHLIKSEDSNQAVELIKSLILIIFDSYIKMGKRLKGLIFIRRANQIVSAIEIQRQYDMIRNEIALAIYIKLEVALVTFAVILVIIQNVFYTIYKPLYLMILIALILFFSGFYIFKKIIIERIQRFL